MYLGQVVGTVVATVKHASHRGQRLLLVQPMTYSFEPDGPVFSAIDLSGAGPETWVFYVKGREAANALPDKQNPSDRTIMGIVDQVTLEALGADRLPGAPPKSRGGSTEPDTA